MNTVSQRESEEEGASLDLNSIVREDRRQYSTVVERYQVLYDIASKLEGQSTTAHYKQRIERVRAEMLRIKQWLMGT